jgi:hypothetical protein
VPSRPIFRAEWLLGLAKLLPATGIVQLSALSEVGCTAAIRQTVITRSAVHGLSGRTLNFLFRLSEECKHTRQAGRLWAAVDKHWEIEIE